jgi:hypothetical protein
MIKRMFRPGHLGGMTANAEQRDTVRADVTGGAVIGTAHFVLGVTLLAVLPRHHAARLRRLMPGNVAAVTTGTCERRIPMWAVLWSVANLAIAYRMVSGSCGDLTGRADMHQSPVTVRALLLVMFRMRHAQGCTQTHLRARFPGMATETTRVTDIRLLGQTIIG